MFLPEQRENLVEAIEASTADIKSYKQQRRAMLVKCTYPETGKVEYVGKKPGGFPAFITNEYLNDPIMLPKASIEDHSIA